MSAIRRQPIGSSRDPIGVVLRVAAVVAAENLVFTPVLVRAPAGEGFELFFDNRDTVPHNARLVDGTGQTIVQTEVFTGPSARVVDVSALVAGTYRLLCDVHPEMSGELIVAL
jgi:plastocyanin